MIAKKMVKYVEGSSVIRAMFEEGKKMAAKYGAENVYDFSLGNPSTLPPKEVNEAIIDIASNEDPNRLHGYMNNSGFEDVREAIAQSLNKRFDTHFSQKNILMTVGAAGGLNVILKSIIDPEDEVIAFAPYFGEYNNYVANFDGKIVAVSPNPPSFQPNIKEFAEKITPKTKAVIINNPNNPTGVVYSEKTIKELAKVLEDKQKEYGTAIYLIADEPYRELAYDGVEVPYLTKYYDNAIVGYSYSKSLSLPGERIGYVAVNPACEDAETMINMCGQISRGIGHNCPPSIIQLAVAQVLDKTADLSVYETNMNILYKELLDLGFTCVKPGGTFYIFPKALEEDAKVFSQKALKYDLVLVPGDSFGAPGYFRMAYCVDTEKVERSLEAFRKFVKTEYGKESL